MKIRNDDLGKLNQLKLDLLSPPYSFRMNTIAADYIDSALEIMNRYSPVDNPFIEQLNKLKLEISSSTEMQQTKKLCRDAATLITNFTLS
jgi:hypothetical protein